MFKTLVAAGSAALVLVFGSVAQAQAKWHMPTGYPTGKVHTENIRQFVAGVDKESGGKLKITVHDSGSLFKANGIRRAVEGGQAGIGEIIVSGFSNEDPMFGLDATPFLATAYPQAAKPWGGSKAANEARFAKQGVKILYAVPWPPQGISSTRPINSAADLKGVKWRSYNPNTSRIAQRVGAQPVTIQAAGAVSAFMTSGATGYDSKVWERATYYDEVNAWLPKGFVIVSQKAFGALDKPTQAALLKAAAAAETRGGKISEEKNLGYKEQLLKNGMTVEPGSPRLIADLRKIGLAMTSDWTRQTGAEGQAIIDAYRKSV